MKILFATDGSPRALSALGALLERSSWFRDSVELVLINVHPPLPYRGAASWVGKEAIERYYDEEGDAALAESRSLLDARKVSFVAIKVVGDAAKEIAAHATAMGCDFIAMGTQGHGALANLALGSVVTKVLVLSSVPVLLLK